MAISSSQTRGNVNFSVHNALLSSPVSRLFVDEERDSSRQTLEEETEKKPGMPDYATQNVLDEENEAGEENDSIEGSSFSFSQAKAIQLKSRSTPKKTSKTNTSILDVVHWLSESGDSSVLEEEIYEPIKVTKLPYTALKSSPTPSPNRSPVRRPLIATTDTIEEGSSYRSSMRMSYETKSIPESRMTENSANTSVQPSKSIRREPKSPKVKTAKRITAPSISKEMKEANRVTRTKDELLSEMVILMSPAVKSLFKPEYLDERLALSEVTEFTSDLPIICWNRRVKAQYDSDRDLFIPCPEIQVQEKNIVLYYNAESLIQKIQDSSLSHQISRAIALRKADNPNIEYKILVIVEGYEQFVNKIKKSEQQQYKNKVLDRLNSTNGAQSKRAKTTSAVPIELTAKEAERLFTAAQVELGVNLFNVRTSTEAVEWLYSFTYTIASSLYDKFERNSSLANLGTVKSGNDVKSTYIQAIRQFKLLTEAKSEKLYSQYPTFHSLYRALSAHGALSRDINGKNLIAPSAESAMMKLFLSNDPDEVINE
ncbi:uncharacterized protein RJT20DRAFT_153988 [Scheffersomyces xylosifermentans]|uniref:uncharacterized protein n=1 Tax=Scheffersomyces xylosifermentans TaxID=1304137 RepID=UPI00315D179B